MKTNAAPDTIQPDKKGNTSISLGRKKIDLTNLHKVYWPEEGYTKGDLIDYYRKITPYLLPYLKNRPLSLKRNPNGIIDEGFYHKDAGESAPSWMKVEKIYSESSEKIIHYLVCNDAASLLYIINLGCIELNPWNSRLSKLLNPDYMVIDLDPSDENSFDQVIQAAKVVKSVMDKGEAECYCKTSGASGLHIYIPLGARYTYEELRPFAKSLASLVVQELPEFTTIERSLDKRNGRMYIDYLQNRQGQTLACTYSLRPKAGAPVSTPLEWKEVKPGLHPKEFTIKNIFKRLEKKGDLFGPVLKKGINVQRSAKLLGLDMVSD